MNSKILVCAHKSDYCRSDVLHQPIQVGRALGNCISGMLGDDTGDNISAKNKHYCELTGMYWAWKNMPKVDYVGLAHYRRYFSFKPSYIWSRDVIHMPEAEFVRYAYPSDQIRKVLSSCDIVLPQRKVFTKSIEALWDGMHDSNDLRLAENVILEKYPQYLQAYRDIIKGGNQGAQYNMFIMPWEIFDKYCLWLFDILQDVERRMDFAAGAHPRVLGFLSEHLINVFVTHNKYKVYFTPVIQISENHDAPSLFRYLGSKIKSHCRFATNL